MIETQNDGALPKLDIYFSVIEKRSGSGQCECKSESTIVSDGVSST